MRLDEAIGTTSTSCLSFLPLVLLLSLASQAASCSSAPVPLPDGGGGIDGPGQWEDGAERSTEDGRGVVLDAWRGVDVGIERNTEDSFAEAIDSGQDGNVGSGIDPLLVDSSLAASSDGAIAGVDGGALTVDGGTGLSSCGGEVVTTGSLLGEMYDLERLSERAVVPFATFSSTSYDRHSVSYETSSTDGSIGWYANHDWGNYPRTDSYADGHSESVMMDVEGPGAIVRMWTATPLNGKVRVYIDDMTTPVLVEDVAAFLGGTVDPFLPPFAGVTAKGYNLEFPFPFRLHGKVTYEGVGSAFFYQVWYRKYDACADVRSYAPSEVSAGVLDTVRANLNNPSPPSDDVSTVAATLDATTTSFTVVAPDGGGEIVQLQARPSRTDDLSLRSTILVMEFDGKETVRAPLGDFFGAGPGLLPHQSLPTQVTTTGWFISRFPMPFRTSAKISVVPSVGQSVLFTALKRPRGFDTGTMYFSTHWTARTNIPTAPFRDMTVARVAGEGAYVGTLVSLKNNSDAWWGEGDDKIWIDSGTFPSAFGTGTEDYFGIAYCDRQTFESPYRLQSLATPPPEVGAKYRGLVSATRFHIMDVLRFSTRLDFEMELWHWDSAATITYDTLAFFYQGQTATDQVVAPVNADFRLPL